MKNCIECKKKVLLSFKLENAVLCKTCGKKLDISKWQNHNYNSYKMLVSDKNNAIALASQNNFSGLSINAINNHFELLTKNFTLKLQKQNYRTYQKLESAKNEAIEIANQNSFSESEIKAINDSFKLHIQKLIFELQGKNYKSYDELVGNKNKAIEMATKNNFSDLEIRDINDGFETHIQKFISKLQTQNYETRKELVDCKKQAIEMATENNFSNESIKSISDHFDSYINAGFVAGIDGQKGQTLQIFERYCVIITNSETTQKQLLNSFAEYNNDNDEEEYYKYDDYDDDEVIAKNALKNIVTKGLIRGAISTYTNYKDMEKKSAEQHHALRMKRLREMPNILVGNDKIYLSSITTVDTYSASNTKGYIRFVPNITTINGNNPCKYFFFEPQKSNRIHEIVDIINDKIDQNKYAKRHPTINITNDHQVGNNIDEIKKYKQLLDEGIITEEEFNNKKKKLLDL